MAARAALANGKVGVIGSCSGGRLTFLYACQTKSIDAVVELWGGRVVMNKEELNPKTPVAPIDFTKDLSCPLLGLFGNDDRAPNPEQVNQHEAELKKHGKNYEFHRYDGAGHGFFYYDRPMYRVEQALDGWKKVFAFFEKHLGEIRAGMCTSIVEIVSADGAGKGEGGWFDLTQRGGVVRPPAPRAARGRDHDRFREPRARTRRARRGRDHARVGEGALRRAYARDRRGGGDGGQSSERDVALVRCAIQCDIRKDYLKIGKLNPGLQLADAIFCGPLWSRRGHPADRCRSGGCRLSSSSAGAQGRPDAGTILDTVKPAPSPPRPSPGLDLPPPPRPAFSAQPGLKVQVKGFRIPEIPCFQRISSGRWSIRSSARSSISTASTKLRPPLRF